MSFHDKTTDAAKGKWKGILLHFGLPSSALTGKHGPCPLCRDGKDRFRWDNKEGSGSYICGQCGAGSGIKLAIEFTGREFRDVASEIDQIVGNVRADVIRPAMPEEDQRQMLRKTYADTVPVAPGDLVDAYLTSRGLGELVYPSSLRFAARLRDGEGGIHPAMVAMVHGPDDEKPVTMHRTFLRRDGLGKAEIASPRKLMPGSIPDGACVRLCEYVPGGPLGIAEGIETAMAASALYEMPVWAAMNSAMLAKWSPPSGCNEVAIFGDCDPKFGGQASAYALARGLSIRPDMHVTVHVPDRPGTDFNDIWLDRQKGKQ